MKLRREIRWAKSIEEQSNSEELFSQKVLSVLPTATLSVFFALIFMMATVLSVRNVYGVTKPGVSYFVLAAVILLVTSIAEEYILYTFGSKKRLASVGIFLSISFGFGCYLWNIERAQSLLGGIVAFLRLFFHDWYATYEVRIPWYVGNANFMAEGVYFVLLYLFFVVLWLAKIFRKNGLLMLPVVLINVGFILVGKVPGKGALFFLLAGMILCAGMSWGEADMQLHLWRRGTASTKNSYLLLLGKGTLFSVACGMVLLLGGTPAQKLMDTQADKAVSMVAGLVDKVEDWKLWEQVTMPKILSDAAIMLLRDESLDYEALTNHMPEYTQAEVLQISITQSPKENLYLRGFCGDIYENGSWRRDLEGLRRACEDAEKEYDAVRAQIAFATIRKLEAQYQEDTVKEPNLRQIDVVYTGMVSEEVYLPYYAQIISQGIGLLGDSGFTKDEGLTHICFEQWNVSKEELPEILCERTVWDNWYEGYVAEKYLDVPKELEIVTNIATQIQDDWEEVYEDEEGTVKSISSENIVRLTKAQAVADWLEENTAYSLCPPVLVEETDPIAYFLGVTRTGYCMHYASAAVMLLREMGVPARYASGYMVEADAFVETGQFLGASVADDRAHAWVEIYLNTLGWIPVEVTKGYPTIEGTKELAEQVTVISGETADVWQSMGAEDSDVSGAAEGGISGDIEDSDVPGVAEGDVSGDIEDSDVPGVAEGDVSGDIEDSDVPGVAEGDVSGVTEDDTVSEVTVGGVPGEVEGDTTSEELGDETSENRTDAKENGQNVTDSGKEGDNKNQGSANIVITGDLKDPNELYVADTKAETRKIFLYVLGVAVFIGIVVILVADTHKFFRSESVYYKQLRKEMKRGNHKRVITMINSGIYRKLQFKKLLDDNLGDKAYETALKSNYKELTEEEWDRYMSIVKAAAFSREEFTPEDVKFCYDIYQDVIYKDEV